MKAEDVRIGEFYSYKDIVYEVLGIEDVPVRKDPNSSCKLISVVYTAVNSNYNYHVRSLASFISKFKKHDNLPIENKPYYLQVAIFLAMESGKLEFCIKDKELYNFYINKPASFPLVPNDVFLKAFNSNI